MVKDKLSSLWSEPVGKVGLAEDRGKVCLPWLLGAKFQKTKEAANSANFGRGEMGSLRLEIWAVY
jgi:hypothetical protein